LHLVIPKIAARAVIDPGFIGDLDRLCVFDGGTQLSLFLCDDDVQLFSRDAQQLGIVHLWSAISPGTLGDSGT
jgi:hypothetical protein